MEHAVKLWRDERFVRPWCLLCSCGYRASPESEFEAKRLKGAHERSTEQSEVQGGNQAAQAGEVR
jgi:hypothetical protein